LPHVNPELSYKFCAAAIKNWWCDATWEMRNKCVSHNVTIIGLTICFFMLHNPYKS
jgi:hypothetical protein